MDFTDGHNIYPAIAKELQGLEIGILGNGTSGYKAEEKHYEVILYEFRNIGGKELRASNFSAAAHCTNDNSAQCQFFLKVWLCPVTGIV